MSLLFDPARHEPLVGLDWDESHARDAIAGVCGDVEAAFDRGRLWPPHPSDDEPGTPADGIMRGLYCGAAGMLHGLRRLVAAGVWESSLDARAIAEPLHDEAVRSPDEPGAGGSLLAGTSGILLVAHRLAPSTANADAIADAIAANVQRPSNELLLGAPGTMLAARAMYERTGERRFCDLWRASARTLLARQDSDGLWTQDLYGDRMRYLGAAHGFAGNVLALHSGAEWLGDAPSVEARAIDTARATALRDGALANWPPLDIGSRSGAAPRVQWCHGAAGIVTCLAALGLSDEPHGALLAAGGELIWHAGPITANAGLCHGTAGNGFAFLALFDRTGDERWLHRARTFAMYALQQVPRLRAAAARGRYTLFTGDIGAALLAAACITGDAAFPGIRDL